jgi:hypothetical protein
MITVVFGSKKLLVPSKWHELRVRTIAIYVREFFLQRENLFAEDVETGKFYHKDVVAYDTVRTLLLQSLLGLNDRDFIKIGIDARHELLNKEKLVDFMFETDIKEQPVDFFRCNGIKHFGPLDFNKITAEEFSFADAACTAFIKTANPLYLDTLMAALFRPKKWWWFFEKRAANTNGDCRQQFNKHLLDGRVKRFTGLNEDAKLAAFWWFHSTRCNLASKFPNLFSVKNQGDANSSGYGWLSIILTLSTKGTFGNYKDVSCTPMHLILTDLDAEAARKEG